MTKQIVVYALKVQACIFVGLALIYLAYNYNADERACMMNHANDGEDYLCSDAAYMAHIDAGCVDDFRKAGYVDRSLLLH